MHVSRPYSQIQALVYEDSFESSQKKHQGLGEKEVPSEKSHEHIQEVHYVPKTEKVEKSYLQDERSWKKGLHQRGTDLA